MAQVLIQLVRPLLKVECHHLGPLLRIALHRMCHLIKVNHIEFVLYDYCILPRSLVLSTFNFVPKLTEISQKYVYLQEMLLKINLPRLNTKEYRAFCNHLFALFDFFLELIDFAMNNVTFPF